jgi:predicted ATPase
MRSEDFFGFARRMTQLEQELRRERDDLLHDMPDSSAYARQLAGAAFARELGDMKRLYGDGLDAHSHGESYLKLFRARFVPNGLYLLDEPEAPLSPARQLGLLALLAEMVRLGGQFIIATHSPIVLAYPGATLYSFDEGRIQRVEYDALEHVTLTRAFLNHRQAYLQHLFD